jgi:hypothetical protein
VYLILEKTVDYPTKELVIGQLFSHTIKMTPVKLSEHLTMRTHNDTIIVLLSGWAGVGKDVAANLMCEEMGYSRLAFADIVRQEISEKTDIPIQYFSSPVYKDLPMKTPLAAFPTAVTYRDVLIHWATERRFVQDDVYAQKIIDIIRSGIAGKKIVISDWRFMCEEKSIVAAFPESTVLRIRILRDSVLSRNVPSEHELDNFSMDAEIANNGSISDLRAILHHLPILQMRRTRSNITIV